MARNLFHNPERYPIEPLSKEEYRHFRRRSAVWRQTLPLQIVLWLLIPGLSALGALYEVTTAPFYRTVVFSDVFWRGLWVSAIVMGLVLLLFYTVQWRRMIAPAGAMQRSLLLSSESIEMEYLPFNSQNLDRHHRLYAEEDQCRERTTIFLNDVTDIRCDPQCRCMVVYGPVHYIAKKGSKILKKGTLTGKHAFRVYCGCPDVEHLAQQVSLYSGVPVRQMAPRERIPVEKQCKLWLV